MSDLAEVRAALEGFQKLLQSLRCPDQQAVKALAALSRMEAGEGWQGVTPSDWTQERIFCEEAGVALLVEPEPGAVTLTIESPIGLNTVTIARYRWDRIVAAASPPPPQPEAEKDRP